MSLTRLMVHDVVLVRAATITDRYGDLVKDWSDVERTTVKGWVAQRDRRENLVGREAQDQTWIVYLPKGTDVTGLDRVECLDLTLEIVGPPRRAWNPRFRAEHHVELDARIVEG